MYSTKGSVIPFYMILSIIQKVEAPALQDIDHSTSQHNSRLFQKSNLHPPQVTLPVPTLDVEPQPATYRLQSCISLPLALAAWPSPEPPISTSHFGHDSRAGLGGSYFFQICRLLQWRRLHVDFLCAVGNWRRVHHIIVTVQEYLAVPEQKVIRHTSLAFPASPGCHRDDLS